ncbi:BGTF surface domain-containing protein [Haladaptatus caseinilyticus]|uniref:BGTF surface domain-containing protein n=1 Tax=Haladaptatus caseinilyticus TaxID=2993314 RepID=UPI00224ADE50|nr:BGTF surface domain-containing protein [Haladaptatus caseinilyticus]
MMSNNYVSTVLAAFVAISLFTGAATAFSDPASSDGYPVETLADTPFDHDTTEANNSSVSLDYEGDLLVLDAAANQTLHGETTLEPDTELLVEIHATSQFFKSRPVAVRPDGTFTATFNFSDYDAETEFGVVVSTRKNNSTAEDPLVAVDGVLQNGTETTTTTTTALSTTTTTSDSVTNDTEAEMTTEKTTPVADESVDTSTTTVESSDTGGQPGFGLVVAMAALAGIALLSRRH